MVALGEVEDLERRQLADKRRDGEEAAALDVEVSRRRHVPELSRESLFFRRDP